ncbi:MAG: Ig-like domain-containing protein [Bacteroidaceae bacterium]|nr:Ig-like domain-containing protein [Bacteroidaceae bacterium]
MKKTYLYSLFARYLTLLILALLSTNLAWGEDTWEKLTSVPKAGDVVILVNETAKREMTEISTTSTKYGLATTYKTSPAGSYPLTVCAGNSDGSLAFKTRDNKYLYWNSGNSLDVNATLDNKTSWTVTVSNGNFTITNVATNARVIKYNKNSGQERFACYASGQEAVQMYKKQSSTPVEPVAPSITTQPKGASYEKDATATALTIAASGNPTPTYQWYSNTTESTSGASLISGATNASYTPSTATIGTKYYYCVATNTQGSATSDIVAVTITAALPKITITADKIADFGSSYKEYTWTANDVSGKCWAYRGGSEGSYNIQFNKTTYVYNTTAVPGRITSVKMTKVSGTTRSWSIYGADEALTGDNYTTAGTQIGSAQEVSNETGTTWNVPNDKNYTYFYITKADGGTNIGEIVITYEEPKTLTSIAVKTAPSKTTYNVGETFNPAALVITATYDDESTKDIAYSDETKDDFTFSPDLTTALTAANNQVTITYGGKTCSQTITVNKIATSLAWSASSYEATISEQNEYPTLTTTPENLSGVTYSSSNPDIANIDANTGDIELIAAGETTIKASFVGDDTYQAATDATYTLTVKKSTDTRAFVNITSVSAEQTTIIKGGTTTLTVTNDQQDWTPSYTYTSDNKDVATVTDGVITAVGKGKATIKVSVNIADEDPNYRVGDTPSKTIEITVNNPSHTAQFSVDGAIDEKDNVTAEEGTTITFPADPSTTVEKYVFKGWVKYPITEPLQTAPDFVNTETETMGTADITYYAVFAEKGGGEPAEEKTQTLKYDTWSCSGSTTDKSTYRLFHSGSYIESAEFDLSKLLKVIVYGGTFGGDSYNSLTIGDGTNTWKSVTVSGKSETGTNTYTDGTPLSGTGKLRITSNSGTATGSGVRISKVEIFTMEGGYTYSNYRTNVTIHVTGISVNPATTTVLAGQTKKLEVTITPADAMNKNVKWTSDDESVATVDANGLVTTLKAGTATIKATSEDGGFTDNCVVTVKALNAISVKTEPRKAYLAGEKFDPTGLVITATYSDTSTEEVTYSDETKDDFTFEPNLETPLKASNDKVTIGYGNKACDLSITVREPNVYHLVTDASQLSVGDVCIIVTKDNTRAMSTDQKQNNRGSVEIVKNDNKITEVNGLQELTLKTGKKENTFAFYTGSGYLYAASSGNNYLNTEETLSDNSSWSISILDGTANIIAQGENSHKVMQFYDNSGSLIFSCYENASHDALSIYKKAKDYTVTIETPENGTLVVKNGETEVTSGNSLPTGTTLTIEPTPADGYKFKNWQYKKDIDDSKWTSNTTTFTYTIGLENVSFRANFEPKPSFTVTYNVFGKGIFTESVLEEESIKNAPTPTALKDWTFEGWTADETYTTGNTKPEIFDVSTPIKDNLPLYAVFKKSEGEDAYQKVTKAQEDWRGNYLIAYSNDVFMDGSLAGGTSGVGAANSSVAPGGALSEDKSTVTVAWGDEHYVTIEAINDEDLSGGYVIKSHSTTTPYFYQTKNENGMVATDKKETAAVYPITITFNNASDIAIALGGGAAGAILHYNATNTGNMFRFYKNGGQSSIYLYKFTSNTTYTTEMPEGATVSVTVNPIGNGSFCSTVDLDFTDRKDVEAYIATSDEGDKLILNKRNKIPAGTGFFLIGTGGTYDVPVTSDECDDCTNNLLSGTIVPYTVKEADVDFVWALSKSDGKLHPVKAGVKIGAGKAYLNKNIKASALSLMIASEPTGVEEIKSQSTVNGQQSTAVYNLQGMRVTTPKKGEVYIMNGKKILMK